MEGKTNRTTTLTIENLATEETRTLAYTAVGDFVRSRQDHEKEGFRLARSTKDPDGAIPVLAVDLVRIFYWPDNTSVFVAKEVKLQVKW